VQEADTDGDGGVDVDEFAEALERLRAEGGGADGGGGIFGNLAKAVSKADRSALEVRAPSHFAPRSHFVPRRATI
jgi:hypothetical protein